jgi:hypothetical protein
MDRSNVEFNRFRVKEGSRANDVIVSLAKKVDFVEALSTKIGQELLRDLLRIYEEKLEKVINGKATERDKEAIVICKCLSALWVDKINSYNRELGMINGDSNGR